MEDTIDTMRDDTEAKIRVEEATPKEPGAAERSRHDLTDMPYRSWCLNCVAGRGVDDRHRKADGCTGPRNDCDFNLLTSRVHLVKWD